jgi:lipoprotein-anchoring transpeptidase ErfK/SrfK
MNGLKVALMAGAASILVAGCGERTETTTTQSAPATPAAVPAMQVAPLAIPAIVSPTTFPVGQTIDRAEWSAKPAGPEALRGFLIRAEVLLARARFSPGVIDGQDGGNLKNAVSAFERANSLPEDGKLDEAVWKLLSQDAAPVMADYVITAEDVAGPFTVVPKEDYAAMAKMEKLNYATPLEGLAEKFHMDEALLQQLNPGVDFSQAGVKILVVSPPAEILPREVAKVEVDKARNQVRAYGPDDTLLAAYPATVGSADMPTPEGEWGVNGVSRNPTWNYDPAKLNFGDKKLGKLSIAAGPNNPVGIVWIDLTKPTYGIHGAPEPRLVGKTASHGCVRLTNWDAKQLASAVKKGVKVVFVGAESAAKKV